ncbi:MAG: fluoride efflux transporter CrcB [Gammaproteobacteria bacterium]|nr:fluoride efflux transporter CrcB [Gammaproteobacteria bacterium]
MRTLLAIAIGGAIGSVSRYLAGAAVHAWLPRTFPWGTLAVNVTGSLLIGLLWAWLAGRGPAAEPLRALLIIGLLGGFTTFSSFSLETLLLIGQHGWLRAGAYVLASVALCLAGCRAGLVLARHLSG